MLVYVNRKPVVGPWGGGNVFLTTLVNALVDAGHTVVHKLMPDVDVIFCMDPRPGAETGLCGYQQLYIHSKTNKTPIVQRVGDVGSHGKPDLTQLVLASTFHSNAVVFPSIWARDFIESSLGVLGKTPPVKWHVIPNAPAKEFYKNRIHSTNLPAGTVKLVTHHWSNNKMKGFDFYRALDGSIRNGQLDASFTFVGRQPDDMRLTNAKEPMSRSELIDELPGHDVYVTASLAEAGANHVLEAAACGLPIIYRQGGGSIDEYCSRFGTSFDGSLPSFLVALDIVRRLLPKIRPDIDSYTRTADDVVQEYVSIIESVKV